MNTANTGNFTAPLLVPEFILFDGFKAYLRFIQTDFTNQTDEKQSWLYRLLVGVENEKSVGMQRYDFYKQAKAVFLTEEDDPKAISIDLMWNAKRNGAPTIFISLPGEQMQSGGNAMGMDQSSNDEFYEYNEEGSTSIPTTAIPILSRRYQAGYSVYITSNNSTEVILIYHVLKSLFIAASGHFNVAGLENVQIGGGDVTLKSDVMPSSLYVRALNLNLQYESKTPSIERLQIFQDALFSGIPKSN